MSVELLAAKRIGCSKDKKANLCQYTETAAHGFSSGEDKLLGRVLLIKLLPRFMDGVEHY